MSKQTGSPAYALLIDLEAERLNRGLSIRSASRHMKISPAALSRAEEDDGKMPDPPVAFKIATYYGFKVTAIWRLADQETATA